jgi:hypothetical protein
MLKMPHRSVTRFFIPLIDVLTLLFCVFLIMPQAKSTKDEEGLRGSTPEMQVEFLRQQNKQLAKEKKDIWDELVALRKQKLSALQNRLQVHVLEIDPKTGDLVQRTGQKKRINSEGAAKLLIDSERKDEGLGEREILYLLLYPADRKPRHPTVGDVERYNNWFTGVPMRFDWETEKGDRQ